MRTFSIYTVNDMYAVYIICFYKRIWLSCIVIIVLCGGEKNNCAFFNKIMQAVRCPSDELSLTNCVFTSDKEQQFEQWAKLHNLVKHVNIIFNPSSWKPISLFFLPSFYYKQTHNCSKSKPELCVYLENTCLSQPGNGRVQSPTGKCLSLFNQNNGFVFLWCLILLYKS